MISHAMAVDNCMYEITRNCLRNAVETWSSVFHVLCYRIEHDGRMRRVGFSHVITSRIQLFIIFLYGCMQPEKGLT